MAGWDVGFIIRHPVFLVTYIIAIPAWIIAFAGQCAAEAKYGFVDGTPVVKYLWFNIWIQLAIIIHLALALGHDSLAIHRWQIAVVLAVAEVFAVYGTDFIFSREGALTAVGVGWLLTAMVDLVWILYLTSEEESFFYRVLNGAGNGGLSSYARGGPRRESSAAFVGGESGLGTGYGGGVGGIGGGGGMGGMGGMGGGAYSQTPTRGMNGGGYSTGGGYAPAATDVTPQKATVGRDNFSAHSPPASDDGGQLAYKHRARAMYSYQADQADPNEVSFAKGDILEVQDTTGKWYQVRTPDGKTGIAPSNYLTLL